jgi:Family of unknown function (DUF695)
MLTLVYLRAVEPLPAAPPAEGLRPVRELMDLVDRVKAKRYPPPGQLSLALDSEWVIVKGTRNGSPLVARLHLGLRALAGHPDYDRCLTVRIPFHEPNAVGFPTKEELHAVCDLEGPLTEVLQEGQQSLPALVITAEGRRELLFHTADAEAALQRLERFRSASAPPVACRIVWNMRLNGTPSGPYSEAFATKNERIPELCAVPRADMLAERANAYNAKGERNRAVADAEFYLGLLSLIEMQAAAGNPNDKCESAFYAGEWKLLHGDEADAKASLRLATDTCPKALVELRRRDLGAKAPRPIEPQRGEIVPSSDVCNWLKAENRRVATSSLLGAADAICSL